MPGRGQGASAGLRPFGAVQPARKPPAHLDRAISPYIFRGTAFHLYFLPLEADCSHIEMALDRHERAGKMRTRENKGKWQRGVP